jgi:hypothetical protein
MLKTLLLFAIIIITVFSSLPTKAQSDDGWFSGRLFACRLSNGDGSALQVHHAQYYNIDNRFSMGLGTGFIFDDRLNVPVTAEWRVYLMRGNRIRLPLMVSGGYIFGNSTTTTSPRIGVETGRLARFRLAADIGCWILGDVSALAVGAGVIF